MIYPWTLKYILLVIDDVSYSKLNFPFWKLNMINM